MAAKKSGDTAQPYLILVEGTRSYYVALDGDAICLPPAATIIDAFDILFTTFFVMNAEYPKSLTFFYNYMESRVYGTFTQKSYPSVVSFCSSLDNFVDEESEASTDCSD